MKDDDNKTPQTPQTPNAPYAPFFSPRQQRIVAAGFTAFCAALVIGFVAVLLWAFCRLLSAVSVVVTPFLVAMILTVIFKPFYRWLYNHLGRVHALALIVFFISLLIPVALVFGVFGSLLVRQLTALVEYLPTLAKQVSDSLSVTMPNLHKFLTDIGLNEEHVAGMLSVERLRAIIQSKISVADVGGTALSYGIDVVKYLLSFVGWLIVPVYLIYFLTAEPFKSVNIKAHLPFLKEGMRDDIVYLVDEFLRIISAFFRGQLIIALIQGTLCGCGFWLVGVPYGLLIGLSLGCLNVIPYLGSIIGLSVTLPLAFFGEGGSLTRLCLVLAVFASVMAVDGYFITPNIQGKRTGLNNVTIIFSLLFWGVAFGSIMGVLLAIPLSAFIVVFWRLLTTKYIREM